MEAPDNLVSSVGIFLLRVTAIGGGGALVCSMRSCCEALGEVDLDRVSLPFGDCGNVLGMSVI